MTAAQRKLAQSYDALCQEWSTEVQGFLASGLTVKSPEVKEAKERFFKSHVQDIATMRELRDRAKDERKYR